MSAFHESVKTCQNVKTLRTSSWPCTDLNWFTETFSEVARFRKSVTTHDTFTSKVGSCTVNLVMQIYAASIAAFTRNIALRAGDGLLTSCRPLVYHHLCSAQVCEDERVHEVRKRATQNIRCWEWKTLA